MQTLLRLGAPLAAAVAFRCHVHAAAPGERVAAYTYVIAPPVAGSWLLRVEATFEGAPSERIVLPEDAGDAVRDVVAVGRGAITRTHDAWSAPDCAARCTVRYSLDLDSLARGCRRIDCPRRVGDALLGVVSSFLLRPEPMGEAVVRVVVRGGDPARFATGLRRDPRGGYVFRSEELGESSYCAFGAFRRSELALPGATLDVSLLGAPLAMGDADAVKWIRSAASCVGSLFGRFPTNAAVFVVPVPGARDVVFGRVMSLTGASVVLLFGDHADAAGATDDWVVVHELFHLGCPSFEGEGRWLEEGLATYFEPILRERAGWVSEAALWAHFVHEMPRGLRKPDEPNDIEARDDIDSTYWGGAMFALAADVSIREATHGDRSLDDVVRAVLAQAGDATHVARVADFVRMADAATAPGAVSDVYESWAVRGKNPDLSGLWRQLGVVPAGPTAPAGKTEEPILFDENAPLAAIRRAIAAGARH